jgi:DNA-binding XRE family transcriptional regulator
MPLPAELAPTGSTTDIGPAQRDAQVPASGLPVLGHHVAGKLTDAASVLRIIASNERSAVGPADTSFARLLRQLRADALLTQEELAHAAGLSPRSISDLERGINRTARKDTALLLARALGLAGHVRELFVAAALGRVPAVEVPAATLD